MSKRDLSTADLSEDQQENVVNAIYFLRVRLEGIAPVARLLKIDPASVSNICARRRAPGPAIAFRLAKAVGVGVDDVLAGKWPEAGSCPRCGYVVKKTR